jgi:hypothetical protein
VRRIEGQSFPDEEAHPNRSLQLSGAQCIVMGARSAPRPVRGFFLAAISPAAELTR